MTTPIRPGMTPLAPTAAPQRSPAALAAQRAFFQQALAQAGQPAAAPAVAQAAQPAATAVSAAPAAASSAAVEPAPRLGRYLDIRV